MLKGIAASQGIAIAKVYKLVQPVLDIQKKDANAEEELSKLFYLFQVKTGIQSWIQLLN